MLLLSVALADALPMPTLTCPRGATVEMDHANEYCAPARCGDYCEGDCEQVGLCVERQELDCGGRSEEGCTYQAMVVSGECSTDADCGVGRCMVEDRCVPNRVKDAVETVKRCGCAIGLEPAGLGLLLLVVGVSRRRSVGLSGAVAELGLLSLLKRSGRSWVLVVLLLLGLLGVALAVAHSVSYTSPFTYAQ